MAHDALFGRHTGPTIHKLKLQQQRRKPIYLAFLWVMATIVP